MEVENLRRDRWPMILRAIKRGSRVRAIDLAAAIRHSGEIRPEAISTVADLLDPRRGRGRPKAPIRLTPNLDAELERIAFLPLERLIKEGKAPTKAARLLLCDGIGEEAWGRLSNQERKDRADALVKRYRRAKG